MDTISKLLKIKKAYQELWLATENGTVNDDFFELRATYRKLMQFD